MRYNILNCALQTIEQLAIYSYLISVVQRNFTAVALKKKKYQSVHWTLSLKTTKRRLLQYKLQNTAVLNFAKQNY